MKPLTIMSQQSTSVEKNPSEKLIEAMAKILSTFANIQYDKETR